MLLTRFELPFIAWIAIRTQQKLSEVEISAAVIAARRTILW
jgi:hypothetical protein